MAAEYIVSRQPQRHPVRARHPDVRDVHPQHAGPGRRAAAPPPDPPAGHRRPVPRDREALAGQAAGDRRRGGRRRRDHGRGPPAPRRGAVGCRAAADPRAVPRHDGRLVPVHEHVRGLVPAPGASSAIATAARRRRPTAPRPRPAPACAASCGCPATSRSATGRCCSRAGRGREPDQGAGDGADVRSTAGIVAALGATVERIEGDGPTVDYRVVLARRRRPDRARRDPRLRQLRDEPAADRGDARRAADDLRPRRRRFVAPPSGGSYHRAAALDGRGAPCPTQRFPPSPDRGRSYPAPGHRLHDAGAERPGQVGDPAGGAAGGRADDGPRGGRDARPHRADAARPGRAGRADGAPDGGVAWTVEGGVAVQAVDGAGARRRLRGRVLAGRRRDPSRRRADPPRRGREPDPARDHRHPAAMGAAIEERPPATAADDGVGEPLADLVVRSSTLRGDRARAGRGGGGDRRDPGPVPRRGRGVRHDRHPRRRRAPAQGVGPDRRHRRRAARARRPDRGRRRRHRIIGGGAPRAAPRPTASTITGWR